MSTLRVSALVVVGSIALAGCSSVSDLFGSNAGAADVTTSSVAQAPRIDPACGNLALEIDTLRREGIAEKVEKAAAKKYTMKPTDLVKASQLNKANGEFQAKCSTLPRQAAVAVPAAVETPAVPTKTATKAAAPVKPAATTTAAAPAGLGGPTE